MLRAAIEGLDENFLLCDAHDRIRLYNRRYAESIGDEPAIGQRFEDFLRERLARGRFPAAAGREEAWIRERLACRRAANAAIEVRIGDRWHLVKDRHLADGSTVTVGFDITERKRTEEALRRSEAYFRNLTDLSSDWYWEQDAELRFVDTTGRDSGRGGITSDTHPGKRRWELPRTDAISETWAEHQAVLAARKPFRNLLLRRTDAGGAVYYIEVSGDPIVDAGGAFTGYRGVAKDVTARHTTAIALRKSAERLSAAIEHLNESIAVTDAEDRIVVANRYFRELNGNTRLVEPGNRYEDHLRAGMALGNFPESAGREAQWLAARLEQRRAGGKVELQRQDGKWLSVTDQRLPDGGMISFGLDVTASKQAELALTRSEKRLRAALENLGEMICLTDAEDRIVLGNRHFVEFNAAVAEYVAPGRRYDEHLRAGIALGMFPDAIGREEQWVAERIAYRRAPKGPVERRRQDGRWLMVDDQVLPDGSIISYGIEITERKRAEEALRNINAELERRVAARTNELKAAYQELESFSYSVSHDLRAPLRAISGYSNILRIEEGDKLSPEGRRYLTVMDENASRMGKLTDALLALMRTSRQTLTRTALDMESIARAVSDELSPEHPAARIEIARLAPASGDETLVRQVFANLISNALKYSAGNAAPAVSIGVEGGPQAPVFSVRDNGVGFEMAYAGKLFRPFERLHSEAQFHGTGIGLALTHLIVQRHGGRIWGEGAPGKGATFRFTLGPAPL